MSRISEAMRRAGRESNGAPAPPDDAPKDTVAEDVATLSREPFPSEAGGATYRRTESRVRDTVEPPPPFSEAETTGASTDPRDGLFERIDAQLAEKTVADERMSAASREQYRRLAAVLHDAQADAGLRVVMIASAVPGEGKTLTATNVALTLSESYQKRVLLVDADLRRPTLHHVFCLTTASGLVEGLQGQAPSKVVLRQISSHLSVLPAGRPTSDPMAALVSERMRQLINDAKQIFDWIILDTPPLMLLPDAHLLSSMVDGTVLVIRANSTPHDQVKRAADMIGRERITGVVLNHADARVQPGYERSLYYGGGHQARYLPEPEGTGGS